MAAARVQILRECTGHLMANATCLVDAGLTLDQNFDGEIFGFHWIQYINVSNIF